MLQKIITSAHHWANHVWPFFCQKSFKKALKSHLSSSPNGTGNSFHAQCEFHGPKSSSKSTRDVRKDQGKAPSFPLYLALFPTPLFSPSSFYLFFIFLLIYLPSFFPFFPFFPSFFLLSLFLFLSSLPPLTPFTLHFSLPFFVSFLSSLFPSFPFSSFLSSFLFLGHSQQCSGLSLDSVFKDHSWYAHGCQGS